MLGTSTGARGWSSTPRPCRHCGGLFPKPGVKRPVAQKFCSLECHRADSLARRTFVCATCGEEFSNYDKARTSRAPRGRHYCSRQCAGLAKRMEPPQIRPCQVCSKEFTPKVSWEHKDRPVRFCSRKCQSVWVQSNRTFVAFISVKERGGLPKDQFALWVALGGMDAGWYPQFWMSSLGEIEGPIHYQLDIADPVRKMNIEVDGPDHGVTRREKDQKRDDWLLSQGWTVLRFTNKEVRSSIDSVLAQIESRCTT